MTRKRLIAAATAFGLTAAAAVAVNETAPTASDASSHREAPAIAGDPRADNTDVYAFVSPDDPDSVTMIANWIPFEEPDGGPNFYAWATDALYNIKVDNDGDAEPDLTYTWVFQDNYRNAADQFLYNTGPVESLDDEDLNFFQTYDLLVTDGDGNTTTILDDEISAPSNVGEASIPDYQALREEATVEFPVGDGTGQNYVGQADDSFFLDLRVFDLLYGGDLTETGIDTLAGYNTNTIALQVPKEALALGGDDAANPVIGVWSTTDRLSADGTSVPRRRRRRLRRSRTPTTSTSATSRRSPGSGTR